MKRNSGGRYGQVVLSRDEHAAYERVTRRILAAWHDDDPLPRFVHRG